LHAVGHWDELPLHLHRLAKDSRIPQSQQSGQKVSVKVTLFT